MHNSSMSVKKTEAKENDLSLFYKLQMKTEKPEELPKFSKIKIDSERLVGVRRLMIELEGKPEMKEFCQRYSNLVGSIADILKKDFSIKPHEEEKFITEVWGIMYGNLNMSYGQNKYGFLWESLKTGEWDCDNSAFLVFDVAKKLGVNAKIATTVSHVFIVTDNNVFETTQGRSGSACYYPVDRLKKAYPVVYGITSDVEAAQSSTYLACGVACGKQHLYKEAAENITKAIELNPAGTDLYSYRGYMYIRQGLYAEAAADYEKVTAKILKDAGKLVWNGFSNIRSFHFRAAVYDFNSAMELTEPVIYGSVRAEVGRTWTDLFEFQHKQQI
jgi:tetratricopeptide (TPR) repeat protein